MFRPKFLAALIIGAALSMAGQATAGDHDIFVFVGQSNTAGRTPLESGDYGAAPNADLLNPNGGWTAASNLDIPDPYFTLPPDYYGFNRYSNIEKKPTSTKKFPQFYNQGLSFATTLAQLYTPANRLGLIFNARGATTIGEWQKGAAYHDPGWADWGAGHNLYSRTLARVQQARQASGGPNSVKALVIDLGLSDALSAEPKSPNDWLGQMQAFVQDFRADVGDANLPVFVAQQPYLREEDYQADHPNAVETVYRYNAALAQWAAQDASIHLVRSDGTSKLSTTQPDSAHYDHTSMTWMGQRLARAVAQHVYGRPPTAQAEIHAAAFHPTQACNSGLISNACKTEYGIKTPDWTLSEDVVVLPHRGYWGCCGITHFPENSLIGFGEVKKQGYHLSEVDFTPTATPNNYASDPSIMAGVMSHDYILYRVTTYPQNFDPAKQDQKFYNMSIANLSSVLLRDRLGHETPSKVATQFQTAQLFQATELLTVGDIKQKEAQGEEFAVNWVKHAASVIYDYKQIGYLHGLSFKTSYSPSFILNNLPGDLKADFNKVLWIPQVASDDFYTAATVGMGNMTWIRSSADYVNAWLSQHSSTLYFEVNYKSPGDSRLKPLQPNNLVFGNSQLSYVNVLDYIKSVAGYRGGGFSEEPISPLGNVNRVGRWEIKNADLDTRGDPLFEAFNQKWGNFGVFTTDRPDVWKNMKCQMFTHC